MGKVKRTSNNKLYVLRKYVLASTIKEAIAKDHATPVEDVWIDEKWKENQSQQLTSCIGYETNTDEYDS